MQTLEIVQNLVDLPLSIDSSVTAAIEAALKVAKGRPLVNSVTGEEEKLEAILPLIKKYNVPVVAISNDETGISMDPDVRFAVAKKIVERCADFGIPAHDVVVDPLVMPIGALGDAGRQVFALLRRLREELKVNTTCGLSNISFGLPHRHGINAAFIPMVIGAGMTSAIMNPCRPQEMEAVRGANVLNGTDENCTTWIRTYKDYKPAEGGAAPIAAPRRAGRTRAAGEAARSRWRPPAAAGREAPGWQRTGSSPARAAAPCRGSASQRRQTSNRTRSSCSCRRASAGAFRSARRCSMPRARSASMSRACAAGAPPAGAARSRCRKAISPSTRSSPPTTTSRPRAPKEERYERVRGLPEGRRLSCSATDPGRPRHRRAAGHGRSTRRSCARRRPTASSSATPPSSSAMSRSTSPTCTSRSAISTG